MGKAGDKASVFPDSDEGSDGNDNPYSQSQDLDKMEKPADKHK